MLWTEKGKKSLFLKTEVGQGLPIEAGRVRVLSRERKNVNLFLGWQSQDLQNIFNSSVTLNNWHWQQKNRLF